MVQPSHLKLSDDFIAAFMAEQLTCCVCGREFPRSLLNSCLLCDSEVCGPCIGTDIDAPFPCRCNPPATR